MRGNFDTIKVYQAESILGEQLEWRKWMKEIPEITLPPGYSFVPIPPYRGAIVRFLVRKNDRQVSVYLDCYDMLGFMQKPYWEIYPAKDGDTERYDMNDVEELVKGIVGALE